MQKAYALFDFDGTILSGDSILLFCLYARKQGLCSPREFRRGVWAGVRYVLGLSTAEKSKRAALAFVRGHSQAKLSHISQAFYQEVLRPRLRGQALAQLESHRKDGVEILLITASPSFYLEPLKSDLGIQSVIGTRMDFDRNGNATGLICGENCKGLQKPLRLAEYLAATGDRLAYEKSYAYGDSASDMPMLALCAYKVGVNAKPGLKKKLRHAEGARFVRW